MLTTGAKSGDTALLDSDYSITERAGRLIIHTRNTRNVCRAAQATVWQQGQSGMCHSDADRALETSKTRPGLPNASTA
jgi:hypothetical protein